MSDPHYNPIVPDSIPKELVHDFNIYDYAGEDPFLVVHRMYEQGVPEIFWTRNNGGHWVVKSASAISEAVLDTTRFSSTRPIVPDSQNFDSPFFIPLWADPPDHAGYRKAVAPLLSPSRIAALVDGMREFTESIATKIRGRGTCEFMSEFAEEMPVVVFLQFLDLPLGDRERLLKIAGNIVKPEDGGHRAAPLQDLIDYLTPIIDARIAHPGSDVISQIAAQQVDGRPLDRDEMMKLTISVLLGGLETTTSSLGFMTRYLAESAEAREELIQKPELIPGAVEELLRRFPPTLSGRFVTEDLTFRGAAMKKGDHVLWTLGMFNLDDRQFPDPMKVDFNRKRAQHMTFGGGIHFCVGAFLARTELRIFLKHWLKIIPSFRLSEPADTYRTGLTMSLTKLLLEIDVS